MSSNYTTGQWVGTIVGAVVGYFTLGTGYVAAAAAIGGAVGGAIDPPKAPKIVGPRLNDLSQQTSSYGAVIPRIYGSAAVMGNVFWIENNALKETSNTSGGGGKGGGGGSETETFTYSATFALGLCEGPIAGVRRIWISGKLIYDAGSDDMGTIQASNTASAGFRVYTGSDTQNPDSRMQATLGVANTPAYRGLAYIVFDDLQLADYGNTLIGAQIKVEVIESGVIANYEPTVRTRPNGTWFNNKWNGQQFVVIGLGTDGFLNSPDGVTWTYVDLPLSGVNSWGLAWGNGRWVATAFGWQMLTSPNGAAWNVVTMPHSAIWTDVIYDGENFIAISDSSNWAKSSDGISWAGVVPPSTKPWSKILKTTGFYFVWGGGANYAYSADGVSWLDKSLPYAASDNKFITDGNQIVIFDSGAGRTMASSDGINWTVTALAFSVDCAVWDGDYWVAIDAGDINNNGHIRWTADFVNWQSSFCNFGTGFLVAAWNGAYISVVGNSPGGTDGVGALTIRKSKINSVSPYLSEVIESEVVRSGMLGSGDIDVTSLIDTVRGYRIASVAAIRSNIDPLQGAWPFDVVQSGYQIKFKRRAGTSVATIDAAMLGAMTDGKIEPRFTQMREMDSQLPYRVNLTYMDSGREYDQGEQYAERLNTDSINVRTIEMPIVLSADEAAQKSEILLYMYWLERYDVAFKLPPQYGYLEPADIITVNTENGTYSLRLTSVNYLSNGLVECSAKFNDNAVYTSNATTDTGTLPDGTITLPGPSIYTLLDIPLLLDAYDTSGFVVAMGGMTANWSGGSIFKSADNGQTWAMINGFAAPSVIGSASNAIAAPDDYRLIDKESALTVSLYGGQSLSSVTEAQMLNGANHFAYGIDGRWEIIAAQNCTLQGDGSYVLTDLLRGRFGSEWTMGSHAAGDGVVLLDPLRIQFAATNLNLIGANLDYRGVSAGQNINSVSSTLFSYDGVNLECLSPVYLNGNRHPSTNDWSLTWIRRTRVGGEWRDYVDATLGEASEAYEVEIYSSGTYATLKRTIGGLTSPSATYPISDQSTDFPQSAIGCTITNPAAESGSATGWTNEAGSLDIRSASPAPHSGSYYFSCGSNAETIARQRIDLVAQGVSATNIDALLCAANLYAWRAGFDGGDLDQGQIGLRFLNSSQVEISKTYGSLETLTQTWVQRALNLSIPSGTRYIDILLRGVRNSGVNLDAYFDDISLSIDTGSAQTTLYVKVYQLSANVGRGYPLTTSITR